jgi:3-hydroxyisobutyrate dehydrogenase-like beta-hydroxyacid dehydrogenase
MSSRLCNSQSHEGPILLWNRTSQVAKDQCKDTDLAKAVETITEAVSLSDIVWSCLADEEAVLSVYGEICKGEISGKLFVECSTITASGSETVAQQLKDKGAEFVTMPGKK